MMGDLIRQCASGQDLAGLPLSASPAGTDLLSTEIWWLVFEQLYRTSPNIAELRLISKRFSEIITTFAFRKARLIFDKHIWRAPAPGAQSEQIFDRGRHSISTLPNEAWSWLDLSLGFQNLLAEKLPNLRFHYDFRVARPFLQMRDLPTINLVSLKLPDPYDYAPEVGGWQQVILDSPNLETLHCWPEHRLSPEMHQAGKKYPAIRELRLEAAGKRMDPYNVLLWDFSNLSVLKLWGVNLKSFFKVLPFEQLSGLTELRVRLWEYDWQADTWVDVYLVPCIEAIARLEVLDIRCAHPHRLLPALEKHRLSLQVLRLAQCRTLRVSQVTVEEIEKLRTLCPYLDELVLDIKVATDAEIEKEKRKIQEKCRELQGIAEDIGQLQNDLFVHAYNKA